MDNLTWIGVVAVLLLVAQLLSLYNSFHAAAKNAHAPLEKLEARVKNNEDHLTRLDYRMDEIKRDVDHAHEKIRENEKHATAVANAQNSALLAILMWIKDPNHEDSKQIDDAIKAITNV